MGATTSWTVWGLAASVSVTDSSLVSAAERIVREEIASVDQACSRFRADSELMRLQHSFAAGVRVSPLLALLVANALGAAQWTDGDVDPTLGKDLAALGYDRDLSAVQLGAVGAVRTDSLPSQRLPGWQRVSIDAEFLVVPADIRLDLGASAKATVADRAAAHIAATLGCGVLVSLGGDIATAGPSPAGDWQVLVQDLSTDPRQQVTLSSGHAMATSSTQKRRWIHAGRSVHHILDPRFGLPAEPVWRSVSVAASSCLLANAYSTAGIVRGFAAVQWFNRLGVAARLVDAQGRIVRTGGWPQDELNAQLTSAAWDAVASDG